MGRGGLRAVCLGNGPISAESIRANRGLGVHVQTVGFYWAKTNKRANLDALSQNDFFTGVGYWSRANVEQCLLATRGSPQRMAKDVRRLVISPRREHSRKPDEVYSRIQRLTPGPYLELFSRDTREGWDAWGNQVALFDDGPVVTRNRPSNMARWEGAVSRRPISAALSTPRDRSDANGSKKGPPRRSEWVVLGI